MAKAININSKLNRLNIFKRNFGGFTMIELLVTIAIIAILSTLAVFAQNEARKRAQIEKAKADLNQINVAINLLVNDTGEWPGHQKVEYVCRIPDSPSCNPATPGTQNCCDPGINELCDDGCANTLSSEFGGLTQNDPVNQYKNWEGPYMQTIPLDPWGNEYFLDTDYDIDPDAGNTEWRAVIGSYGPDGLGNNGYDPNPGPVTSNDDIIRIIGFE